MIRNKASKFDLGNDILLRYLHGANFPDRTVKKGSERCKRGKLMVRYPPIGGWLGGHQDRNGLKQTETYGMGGKMRKSECWKKGKAKRA